MRQRLKKGHQMIKNLVPSALSGRAADSLSFMYYFQSRPPLQLKRRAAAVRWRPVFRKQAGFARRVSAFRNLETCTLTKIKSEEGKKQQAPFFRKNSFSMSLSFPASFYFHSELENNTVSELLRVLRQKKKKRAGAKKRGARPPDLPFFSLCRSFLCVVSDRRVVADESLIFSAFTVFVIFPKCTKRERNLNAYCTMQRV